MRLEKAADNFRKDDWRVVNVVALDVTSLRFRRAADATNADTNSSQRAELLGGIAMK